MNVKTLQKYQSGMWINNTRLDYLSGFKNVETSSESGHKKSSRM
jgi:hypothetical protein